MAHERDDHGYPLNPQCCLLCSEISQYLNERFVLTVFSPDGHDPEVSYRKPSNDKELPE